MGNQQTPTMETVELWITGLRKLRQFKQNCRRLKKNECDWMLIMDEDEPEHLQILGEALLRNTAVKRLLLFNIRLNEPSAKALGNGIGGSQLESLQYSEYGWNSSGVESYSHYLCQGLGTSQTLRDITLCRVNSCCQLAFEILVNVPSLHKLVLYQCPLGVMDDDGNTSMVAQALCCHTTLQVLELADCRLYDEDVIWLLDSLFHSDLPIQRLSLEHNRIGPMGMHALLRAVSAHATLTELDLTGNTNIGYAALASVGDQLKASSTLRHAIHVSLCNCTQWVPRPTDNALALVQEHERCQAEQALLNCVKDNPYIHALDVEGNRLADDIVIKVRFGTQVNKLGRYLLASAMNDLPWTVGCHIFAKCQREHANALSLVFYFLQEQPHLVKAAPVLDPRLEDGEEPRLTTEVGTLQPPSFARNI